MPKIEFGKKIQKYRAYREKYNLQQLRTIKLISSVVNTIIINNDKNLSNNDIKELCIKVYGSYNKIKHVRVRNMIKSTAMQEQINNKLMDYYIRQGIDPVKKVVDLSKKAEEVAKSTSDYMLIAKHYKDIAEIEPQTTAKQTEIVNYNEYMQPVSKQVKREISTTTAIDSNNIVSQKDTEVSVSQQNAENSEKTQ